MNRHQDIYYNVTGQALVWDAPEGRPSSVTSVSVYEIADGDDATTESATTGSASVETNPNTTLDAAAGFGQSNPRTVPVAATTGFAVGREYLLTAANGYKEWFEVGEISSGVSVTAKHPLHNTYASADTVESTRISISVDSTWVADKNNITDDTNPNPGYRVRWEYVVGGVTYVWDSYFDLVRYAGGHTVKPTDMEAFLPNWVNMVPTYHQDDQGQRLIDEAYQQLRWDLHQSGHPDEVIRSREGINELVKHRAWVQLEMAKIANGSPDVGALDRAATMYQSRLDQLVRVQTKLPEAISADGGGHTVSAVGLFSK